jgi:hypothetical protein
MRAITLNCSNNRKQVRERIHAAQKLKLGVNDRDSNNGEKGTRIQSSTEEQLEKMRQAQEYARNYLNSKREQMEKEREHIRAIRWKKEQEMK